MSSRAATIVSPAHVSSALRCLRLLTSGGTAQECHRRSPPIAADHHRSLTLVAPLEAGHQIGVGPPPPLRRQSMGPSGGQGAQLWCPVLQTLLRGDAGGVTTEPSSFDTWWAGVDDVTRQRILNLQAGDHVPGDLALAMQLHGVRVLAVGVVWSQMEEEWIGLYEQPPEVIDLLASVSGDHPG